MTSTKQSPPEPNLLPEMGALPQENQIANIPLPRIQVPALEGRGGVRGMLEVLSASFFNRENYLRLLERERQSRVLFTAYQRQRIPEPEKKRTYKIERNI